MVSPYDPEAVARGLEAVADFRKNVATKSLLDQLDALREENARLKDKIREAGKEPTR